MISFIMCYSDVIILFSSISTATLARLEPDAHTELEKKCAGNIPAVVYFNKGL